MSKKFFTNQDSNTLFQKLQGIFDHNKNIHHFDALVGFFRSSGYFAIRPLLDQVNHIRILVGIDVDKLTRQMNTLGLKYQEDVHNTQQSWQEKCLKDIHEAKYDLQVEHGIKQFFEDLKSGKVKLHAHPSKNIHAKIYIFRPEPFNEHTPASVITGSSNLTDQGLGTHPRPNYEFNVLLNDYDEVKFATSEFEQLWQESTEIPYQIADDTIRKTHLADTITPYELYLKLLIEYFGDEIEFDPNSIQDLPSDFKRLSYQLDAVNQGYEMLKKHNGFFLADVVGLGKTIVATLIARQFYYANGYPNHRSKTLLVIPPALRQNWQDTLRKFKIKDSFDLVHNGSLHTVEHAQDYDMVIVDEAHKFRNEESIAYKELQKICKTPAPNEASKKIILISATPLNNRPKDLENQIYLFQDGYSTSLDFSLSSFFSDINKQFKEIKKIKDTKQASRKTQALYKEIRQKAIEPLMVRRTRTDLLNNQRYREDLEKQGITFPQTTPPQPIYYQLEASLELLYDRTIEQIDNKQQENSGLLYMRYRILEFLKPDLKQQYQRADFVTQQLVGIMKTMLLKRMDSSFEAFRQTLSRFIKHYQAMQKMIQDDRILIAPKIKVEEYILDDQEEELMRLLSDRALEEEIGVYTRNDFSPEFSDGIDHDLAMLLKLKSDWEQINQDPKLEELFRQLNRLSEADDKNKVVIFTESTDTMRYLCERFKQKNHLNATLFVNAQNRDKLKQSILENFDANHSEQKNDYRIIVTTDVLAEGINLHRANRVINYDTPWNATKLMQRIGRVNRIGQQASRIYVHNFFPASQIDNEIELKKKAQIKLQAFHSALGEDSQIYSTDEEVDTFGIFDANMQEEVNETLVFLEIIRQYRKTNPQNYERIKNMPTKVRNAIRKTEQQNSTLVFVRTQDQSSARFYFVSHEKQIDTKSFLQAADFLKCDPSVRACALHQHHHSQVQQALDKFIEDMQLKIVEKEHKIKPSTAESKAIKFLKALIPHTSDSQKIQLEQAIEHIKHKRFQDLAKQINKVQKQREHKNHDELLAQCLDIVKQYESAAPATNEPTHTTDGQNTTPTIVISQSYT